MEITKTQKYLFPALYFGYDAEFKLFLRDLAGGNGGPKVRINSYLGDRNSKTQTEKCIYILLKQSSDFDHILKTFRTHESYKDDYEVGNHDSDLHMVVCKLNNEQAYNYFMISRYSKMYPDVTLERNFALSSSTAKKKRYISAYHVLKKTEERKKEIMKEFGVKEPFEAPEYEGVLNMKEEVFDYNNL